MSKKPSEQFDFWLGEWDAAWGDGNHGSNSITRVLDDKVIFENFDGNPSMPLKGISTSVYDENRGSWLQTWVDNQGSYLDFTGAFTDGKMVLERNAVIQGKPVRQRMVWYNIQADQFDWNWERSEDDGKNWQVLWQIHYTRRNMISIASV